MLPFFWAVFDRLLFMLAGIDDIDKSSHEFEIRPDQTSDYGVSSLACQKKIPVDL